jgi:hypothetical protein
MGGHGLPDDWNHGTVRIMVALTRIQRAEGECGQNNAPDPARGRVRRKAASEAVN